MMKYIVTAAVFVLTLFFLISCDQGPKQSADGYKFEKEYGVGYTSGMINIVTNKAVMLLSQGNKIQFVVHNF